MGLVKLQKNKSYFKRFQVKFKRRREGKTDYKLRQSLITQDKTKLNAPKKRFVVRVTNTKVICQIIQAKLQGDEVLCAAYSTELPRYGMPVGLSNYAAAYATGLLCARRFLKKIGQDSRYKGVSETDGSDYLVEAEENGPRPLKCYLDIGLTPSSRGNRVFGAMKGACDGGIYIPHNNKKFPGYDPESGEYNPEIHRNRIYGTHVADWMQKLKDENEEEYKSRFSQYIKNGITPDNLEDTIKKVHQNIRANPDMQKVKKERPAKQKRWNKAKLDLKTRKERVAAKKARLMKKLEQMQEEE